VRGSMEVTSSDGQPTAALTTTTGEDSPARTRTHPQPKPVRLRPAPVVGLERTLAHL
jgi:hypothetical protein